MKNICIFTNTLCSGGAERQAVYLASVLCKEYNVWLVIYYGEQTEQKLLDFLKANHVNCVFLTGNTFNRIYSFYRFLQKNKIQIIFSYLLTTNFVGGLIGKLAGVSHRVGGIRSSKLDKNKIPGQRFLQNHVNDFTIYNNYCGLAVMTELGFYPKKTRVIPNYIEMNRDITHHQENKPVFILSVGRFHEAKDYETAIKTIVNLKKRFHDIQYIIIGYGSLEKQTREWVRQYNAEDFIQIVINPFNVNEYYKEADIYFQTSIVEGLSNTVMEAMNFSLPLVLTDVGDNNKMVSTGDNGFLCKPKDVNSLSTALYELCCSFSMRKKFGENSYSILNANYSAEIFKRNYIDFIENLPE